MSAATTIAQIVDALSDLKIAAVAIAFFFFALVLVFFGVLAQMR